jgi:dTDP-4-amino-4,6-dideoxygalactose transaminase
LADTHDLALVEDAAQAHGAKIDGEHVGAIGDIGCFSFYPTKNMTTGEGGMVVTDDENIAARARAFVNHGREGKHSHPRLGHNYRMPNVAGAIGVAQLPKLSYFVDQRRTNARQLADALPEEHLDIPVERPGTTHSYHQFTIRTDDRDDLLTALHDEDIGASVYYPTPIHEQAAYDEWDVSMPVAERAAERVLSLPVHPGVSESDIEHIATAVDAHCGQSMEVNAE